MSQQLLTEERVRVASTANVNLASALVNGASIDGVSLVTGDRVLLKNQTTASEERYLCRCSLRRSF